MKWRRGESRNAGMLFDAMVVLGGSGIVMSSVGPTSTLHASGKLPGLMTQVRPAPTPAGSQQSASARATAADQTTTRTRTIDTSASFIRLLVSSGYRRRALYAQDGLSLEPVWTAMAALRTEHNLRASLDAGAGGLAYFIAAEQVDFRHRILGTELSEVRRRAADRNSGGDDDPYQPS